MFRRVPARAAAALLAVTAGLAACGEPAGDDHDDGPQAGIAGVTFRVWDEAAAVAYRESFDAFNAIYPEIHVEVEVVPRETYASTTDSDVAAGTMADLFWASPAGLAPLVDAGKVVNVGEVLDADVDTWAPADLYTRDGELWAVPQLADTTILFYNSRLVEEAGVDPTDLTWVPPLPADEDDGDDSEAQANATDEPASSDEGTEDASPDPTAEPATEPATEAATEAPPHARATDTFRPAVLALTRDSEGHSITDDDFDAGSISTYGFNPDLEDEVVWLPFLAQAGGRLRTADGFALASPQGEAAFQYLADLAAIHHSAPAAVGEEIASSSELFLDGRLALLQATSRDLRHIAANAGFTWGVAPVAAGPEGAVSVVDGVAIAANADTENMDAAVQVMQWLASTDGQSALASQGVGVPAAPGAQDLFARSWADQGVDAGAVLEAISGPTVSAPGPHSAQDGLEAMAPVLAEIFRGELPVQKALPAAQEAANRAASP